MRRTVLAATALAAAVAAGVTASRTAAQEKVTIASKRWVFDVQPAWGEDHLGHVRARGGGEVPGPAARRGQHLHAVSAAGKGSEP